MSHLDEGRLTSLLDNELSAEARQEAESHLAGCAECRSLYDEIRAFSGEADALVTGIELPRKPAPLPALLPGAGSPIARRPLPWRTLGWAATLVAALGLGYLARGMDRQAIPTDVASAKQAGESQPTASESASTGATGLVPLTTPPAAPTAAAAAEPSRQNTPAAPPRRDRERAMPAPELAREEAEDARARTTPSAPAAAGAAPAMELAAADQAVGATKTVNRLTDMGFQPVTMERAVRILGGTIRLLDGLEPERVLTGPGSLLLGAEPGTPVVRIVYEDPPGRELWLDQQRPQLEERSVAPSGAMAGVATLLPGDTVLTVPAQGMQSVRWLDQHGFRLALTGFLPTDSLRGLQRRVQ
jgi:anti-sigma factor RsiW